MASNLPSTDELSEHGELLPPTDSLALLSKPPKDLTRDDLLAIMHALRAKRVRFLHGQPDRPTAARRAPAPKPTAESKAATTEALKGLLGNIKL